MQVQNRINKKHGTNELPPRHEGWYRCKSVIFDGETARWELSRTGHYEFLDAYKMNPHRQLIQATNDSLLRAFIKEWGPLRGFLGDWSGSDSIDAYRMERDRVTVAARILASVEEPDSQRFALQGFVDSLGAWDLFPPVLAGLRGRYKAGSNVGKDEHEDHREWVESLTQNQLSLVIAEIAPMFAFSAIHPKYILERGRAGNVLKASLSIPSSRDAMTWMLWQDISRNHPIQFCVECRGLIEFKTHHAKKFCSPECAHRKTARESARRRRNEERKTNVTQKTR